MKALIIAEKPSVARDIAAALPGQFRRSADRTHLESDRAVVSWAVGHLVALAEPDDYQPEWKQWRMEHLPMLPDAFKLKPASSKTAGQLKALRALLKRADVDRVVNACDAGREGELIFRYIMQHSRCSKPVKRLWLASMTPEAIRAGLGSMRDGADFDGLADAARCRSEADWLVGMNASRAATLTLHDALGGAVSVGRVQTPTLAIIVRRELEIRDFTPEDYWVVAADFATSEDQGARRYRGVYRDGHRFASEQDAQRVADAVRGSGGHVAEVQRKDTTDKPPLLYDLTTLQREASGAFSLTAARTLETAQALYEKHKLITYPRTDSRWLSQDLTATLPALVGRVGQIGAYEPIVAELLGHGDLPVGQVTDDAKVTDHHAIIPTGKTPPAALTTEEAAVFDMVCRRLLAALMPASVSQRTRVRTDVQGHEFVTKGRIVVKAGWRAAYQGAAWFKTEEQALPDLRDGEPVDVGAVETQAKQTQPPKRLTDATLLAAMETAGKLVDDDEAREAMKESGLGTPATRAAIIERLVAAKYVRRDRKTLVPTDKGVDLIRLLGEHPLASAQLTGDWERRLGLIARNEEARDQFMSHMRDFSGRVVTELAALGSSTLARDLAAQRPADTASDERPVLAPCPLCKRPMRETKKSWSCWTRSDPGCGFAIWKTMSGRKLPKKVALELATKYRTSEKVTGFKSRKTGETFDAHLKCGRDREGKPVVMFDFARDRQHPPAAADKQH